MSPGAFFARGMGASLLGDYELASQYGDIAKALLVERNAHDLLSRFAVWALLILTRPIQLSLKPHLETYQLSLRYGDTVTAGIALIGYLESSFISGKSLTDIELDCERYYPQMKEFANDSNTKHFKTFYQVLQLLIGKSENENSSYGEGIMLHGEVLTRDESDKFATDQESAIARNLTQVYLILFCLYLGEFEAGAKVALAHQKSILKEIPNLTITITCIFAQGIIFCGMAKSNPRKQGLYKRQAKRCLKLLRNRAKKGNPNVHHYVLFIEAELVAACKNPNFNRASELFQEAIKISGRAGFVQDCALAHERYGELCLKINEKDEAVFRFNKAFELYKEWGAKQKHEQMKKKYSGYI